MCLCKEEIRDILDFLGFVIFRYIIEGSNINKWKVTFIPRDAKYTSVSISFWNFNVCYSIFLHCPELCVFYIKTLHTLFNIFFFNWKWRKYKRKIYTDCCNIFIKYFWRIDFKSQDKEFDYSINIKRNTTLYKIY